MSIKQRIEKLEKEMEKLDPNKNRLYIIKEDEDGLYYEKRNYKTLAELKEKESIKNSERITIISKIIADKYEIK